MRMTPMAALMASLGLTALGGALAGCGGAPASVPARPMTEAPIIVEIPPPAPPTPEPPTVMVTVDARGRAALAVDARATPCGEAPACADDEALKAAAAALAAQPGMGSVVHLAAHPSQPYARIVAIMAALQPSFPDVVFVVPSEPDGE